MDWPQRKLLRLPNTSYGSGHTYFFTVVTLNRQPLLGHVHEGIVTQSTAGNLVVEAWLQLPERYQIVLDEFQLMPDHVHGILHFPHDITPSVTLPLVMRGFKSMSALAINRVLNRSGSVWQRSYHDRVLRNQFELDVIRDYIRKNPGLG